MANDKARDADVQSLDRLLRDKLSGIEITAELLNHLTEDEYAQVLEGVEQLRRIQATQRYADYVEYVHHGAWKPFPHVVYLCDQIDEFLAAKTGNPYDIMILSMPPQDGKSITVTETLPSYFLGKNPDKRVIIASYADEFARHFGRCNLQKVSEHGGELFGIKLAKTPRTDELFELAGHTGRCMARGLMGQITGRPADLFIIDDPVKGETDAGSQTARENVWGGWNSVVKSRVPPGAKIIVIMTRWDEDDLAGRIVRMESEFIWKYINLPEEAEDNDMLGRAPGDALAPGLGKDKAWIAAKKRGYEQSGMRAWWALHQGRPRTLQGNLIKECWFGYWFPRDIKKPAPRRVVMLSGDPGDVDSRPLPLEFDEFIQSWDCTFKDALTSDYVVGTVWGRYGIDYYLLDMSRAQRNIADTMDAMRIMSDKWPQATIKLIEDKANGPAVISLLRNEVTGIIAINPRGSKENRVNAALSYFESGHIFIPHPTVHRWANDVIDEFVSFPDGRHDDIVDSCTQAIMRLSATTSQSTRKALDGPGAGRFSFGIFRETPSPVRKPSHRAKVIDTRR